MVYIYRKYKCIFRIMFLQLVLCVWFTHESIESRSILMVYGRNNKQRSKKQHIVNCGISRGSYYLYVRIGSIWCIYIYISLMNTGGTCTLSGIDGLDVFTFGQGSFVWSQTTFRKFVYTFIGRCPTCFDHIQYPTFVWCQSNHLTCQCAT